MISEIINWGLNNPQEVTELVLAVIGLASVVVKLTPTLKDDNILKPIIKFVGKFIALNRK